jgi:hypothetical protein
MSVAMEVLAGLCGGLCALAWFVPLLLLAIEFRRRTDDTYRAFLKRWAGENGLEILHCRRREFGSPWMFSKSGAQWVYYVTVMYHEGTPRIRRAWVRCGGWLLGPRTEKVDVRWDGVSEPLPQPEPEPEPSRPQDDPLWDPWVDR